MSTVNSTLTLLQARLRKNGGSGGPISPQAIIICELIDHWNTLHWNDRNRYGTEITKLAEENRQLRARLHALETKGLTE